MNDTNKPENAAQKGAQKFFTKTAHGEALAKETSKKARAAEANKMAKLRALRLAKESGEKGDAAKLAEQKTGPGTPAKSKRAAAAKPVKMLRMSY
jgi:hypothetical protein